jgi:hypothetical protein
MITQRYRTVVLALLLVALPGLSRGGDAVAIGYNADGVWTSVTYYSSGTPKGGRDYKDEAAARAAAIEDLKRRAGEGIVRTEILASSDRTAYAAYARGKRAKEDVHAVGYGASKQEAERSAFAELSRRGGTRSQKVIYNYFSHGAESSPKAR